MFFEILIYLLLGTVIGFLSGLFGIGGGIIITPVLVALFKYHHVPSATIHQLAAGTSMSIILFTGISAAWNQRKHPLLDYRFIRNSVLFGILGTLLGISLIHVIPGHWLEIYLALFILFIASNTYRRIKKKQTIPHPSPDISLADLSCTGVYILSLLVGIQSGLLGLAGGVILTAYLLHRRVSIQQIIPNIVFCWLPIAFIGTLVYILSGLRYTDFNSPYYWGYLYWPAALGILSASMPSTRWGVHTARKLSTRFLELSFVLFLSILGATTLYHAC